MAAHKSGAKWRHTMVVKNGGARERRKMAAHKSGAKWRYTLSVQMAAHKNSAKWRRTRTAQNVGTRRQRNTWAQNGGEEGGCTITTRKKDGLWRSQRFRRSFCVSSNLLFSARGYDVMGPKETERTQFCVAKADCDSNRGLPFRSECLRWRLFIVFADCNGLTDKYDRIFMALLPQRMKHNDSLVHQFKSLMSLFPLAWFYRWDLFSGRPERTGQALLQTCKYAEHLRGIIEIEKVKQQKAVYSWLDEFVGETTSPVELSMICGMHKRVHIRTVSPTAHLPTPRRGVHTRPHTLPSLATHLGGQNHTRFSRLVANLLASPALVNLLSFFDSGLIVEEFRLRMMEQAPPESSLERLSQRSAKIQSNGRDSDPLSFIITHFFNSQNASQERNDISNCLKPEKHLLTDRRWVLQNFIVS
ncbi:unnamed protein product [Protopolystoma xenopodis]|uniref:Uncharacterized protein n=1 Tax=Protopolystoma xenopodis TaxID=117903 RepID=A0A3S5CU24_9PLAT|nr:unnamed protein product [Protopolystoma xenopodis]